MSTNPDLDRRITAWLDAQAPMREPDGLFERVAGDLAHTRRLPGWVVPERWLPMQTTARFGTAARAVITLALVAVLLAVFAALVVAAQPKPAPPVGLARNGLIAFPREGDIWVVDPDGSGPRRLLAGPGYEVPVVWSPDGRRIAYWSFAYDGDPSDRAAVEAALTSPTRRAAARAKAGRSTEIGHWRCSQRLRYSVRNVNRDRHLACSGVS